MTNQTDINSLWDYDDPAETEARFSALLPQAEADPAYYAELLTQIARTYGLRREFAEAHRILDTVEPMLAEGFDRARIRYYLERGRTYNSAGEKTQASEHFLQAWELASKTSEDFFAVDAAHMLGISEPDENKLAWHLKGLKIAANSDDEKARGWGGSLCNNIGWTYHDQGDYETALTYFEKALVFRQEAGQADNIRVARWCIARCLRSLGRVEDALTIQQALQAELEGDGYVHEELGECYLLLNQPEKAKSHFSIAYAILSTDVWLQAEEPDRLARLKQLGAYA